MIYDTLKLSKALQAAFTPEQAEVITNALNTGATDNLATKADLADLKVDIVKWIVGALIVNVGLVVSLIKIIGH